MDWLFPTAFSSWRPGDGSAESSAVDRVLRSDRLTAGAEVAAFEQEIAEFHGRRFAIATNSGSSANLIAVAALLHRYMATELPYPHVPPGTKATMPAISWATFYAPFVQHGFNLDLCDVDETWNAPAPGLGARFTACCPILGNPAHMDEYAEFKNTILFEDGCESTGARTEAGRRIGTIGAISTGSGFFSHQISAREMGWALTDDPKLAHLMRLLSDHGNAGWENEEFEKSYDFQLFGYNVRATEIYAAIAREQLRHLDEMVEARRTNLRHFVAQTHNLPIRYQKTTGEPSPFGLPFTLEDPSRRSPLVTALRANGIDARLPTGGSFLKHFYGAPWREQSTPKADHIHDAGIFLGNAPYPIPELIDKAVEVMRNVL